MDKDFLKWLAGFFEGEGTFCIKRGNRCCATVSITQSEKNNGWYILSLIKDNLGVGKIIKDKNNCWRLYISDTKKSLKVMREIIPYTKFKTQEYVEKINKVNKYFTRKCKFCGNEFWAGRRKRCYCNKRCMKAFYKIYILKHNRMYRKKKKENRK